MGTIKALCISEKKGTLKTPVHKALFQTEWGMVGDAHAGRWHRQVSFLGLAEIEAFRKRGIDVKLGAFGENIVAEGFRFKECHKSCAIRSQVGDCIMPREGVFARVLHGGWIEEGDSLEIVEEKMPLDAAIITASDKGSKGLREDESGAKVQEMLEAAGYTVAEKVILPDEQHVIEHKMRSFGDRGIALVVTTGGTGFSVRDVTPEATLAVCERLAPGIPEAMRALSMQVTHRAMLSRAQAGIYKRTLIVNLPGSRKAVEECLGFVLPELLHGIEILRGDAGECARK